MITSYDLIGDKTLTIDIPDDVSISYYLLQLIKRDITGPVSGIEASQAALNRICTDWRGGLIS